MKTASLFTAIAFLVLFAGCSEVSVDPIVAKNPVKANPALQRIQLNESIELSKPDGSSEMAYLTGEITYQLTPVLAKTLPAKPLYSLRMEGKGEISLAAALKKKSAAKPSVYAFSGSLTSVVEEGGEIIATFTIEGFDAFIGHVHFGFVAVENELRRSMTYVDFHEKNAD